MGTGVGIMLTPSVNIVQSAFPENQQGEISGLSRSVSTWDRPWAPRSGHDPGLRPRRRHRAYGIAIGVLAFMGLLGLVAAISIPRARGTERERDAPSTAAEGRSQG